MQTSFVAVVTVHFMRIEEMGKLQKCEKMQNNMEGELSR
jgi:hypothetical protein